MLFWVYILESLKDSNRYVGYTININKRLKEHRSGYVFATKFRLPIKLIYLEACVNKEDAMRREQYLKTTRGRRFLAKRLKSYYKSKL